MSLVSFGCSAKKFEKHHYWEFIVLTIALIGFGLVINTLLKFFDESLMPTGENWLVG